VFQNVPPDKFVELVYKIQGICVLSMDDKQVLSLSDQLGKDILVLSIRDSKGCEFNDVMIVNFFNGLPKEHQKAWKLLIKGNKEEAQNQPGFPEIETHLKQLYTAITRCQSRLFFVEIGNLSDSGEAFVRVSKNKELLVQQTVEETENIVKTPDEWASTGKLISCTCSV